MPPILALIICSVFVLVLLFLERRQSRDVSNAAWLPLIWILLVSSKPLAYWFGYSGVDMETGSPLDRYFITFLIIIGIAVLFYRQFRLAHAIKEYPFLILLVAYMLVSIIWSEMPYTSLKRWIRDALAPIIMAFVILSDTNPKETVESILRRAIYILIPFSYILIHYFPLYGRQYGRWSGQLMWIGVSNQKNSLAALSIVAIVFITWSFFKRRRNREIKAPQFQTPIDIFMLCLAIWLFMGPSHTLTYSATATAALFIGLFALLGLSWLRKSKRMIGANSLTALIVIIIAFGTLAPFLEGWLLSDVASYFNRTGTLTGRTEIWAYLLPYALQEPILGYGFGGFWTDAIREATSSHAHNGYLDILLNIGSVGLFLFSLYFISCCRSACRLMKTSYDWGCLWICVLLMALVHNITESTATSLDGIMSILNLFMLMLAAEKSKENNSKKESDRSYIDLHTNISPQ